MTGKAPPEPPPIVKPSSSDETMQAWRAQKNEMDRCYAELRQEAQASFRALSGWDSVQDADAWARICEESRQSFKSGHFLIERLGAEKFLDPGLAAVLLRLRQTLIAEFAGDSPSASLMMLVDLAIISYYNCLRVTGWIGDLALVIEHEFFGQPPAQKVGKEHRSEAGGLIAEDPVERLRLQLLPVLDRANRMFVRNLQAIRELRQGPRPTLAIGKADQVNVAEQAVNLFHQSGAQDR